MRICGIRAWKSSLCVLWSFLLTSCPRRCVVTSLKSGISRCTSTISSLTGLKVYKSCVKCQKNVGKRFFVAEKIWASWVGGLGFPEADLKQLKKQNVTQR